MLIRCVRMMYSFLKICWMYISKIFGLLYQRINRVKQGLGCGLFWGDIGLVFRKLGVKDRGFCVVSISSLSNGSRYVFLGTSQVVQGREILQYFLANFFGKLVKKVRTMCTLLQNVVQVGIQFFEYWQVRDGVLGIKEYG